MNRVEFRLTMPGKNSWNGKWTGEDKIYVIYKTLTKKKVEQLGLTTTSKSFCYSWDDGWRADVRTRILEKGEKKKNKRNKIRLKWIVLSINYEIISIKVVINIIYTSICKIYKKETSSVILHKSIFSINEISSA